MKKGNMKKFLSYYKPYKKIFAADMFFACLGAAVTLVIPLIIRYITSDVIYRPADESLNYPVPDRHNGGFNYSGILL